MRVLVTGASGTLAPFVIRALWERHEVVLLSRRPPLAEFAALPWIQGDITMFDDCWRAAQGMDAIQHLAAQPWPVDHPRLREQAQPRVCLLMPPSRAICLGRIISCRLRLQPGWSAW